jgi:diguanylate cyclase (GGDEF)-like protein/PAS domain S-box-containing protein
MNYHFSSYLIQIVFEIKQSLNYRCRELITIIVVASLIILLRIIGLLQILELAALDQFFRLRFYESSNELITIVAIDESSLQEAGSWPINDEKIAEALYKLSSYNPSAIGLDIYRNFPVEPGYEKLRNSFQEIPNLIGIELLSHNKNNQVLPPLELKKRDQVGFNNVLYDLDGIVRRNLLYLHFDNQEYQSFSLKLAFLYLKSQGITPQKATTNPEYLQLGKAVFNRFKSNDGGYVGADARGYQILSNFPKPCHQNFSDVNCAYHHVSFKDVLADRVPENLIRDRIILIGSTAPSLQDFLFIPYSSNLIGMSNAKPISGVELQAYFIDELISAAMYGRPLIKVWSDFFENLWILIWSFLGVIIISQVKELGKSIIVFIIFGLLLTVSVYIGFLYGWWIPIVPAWLTFCGSAIAMIFQIAYVKRQFKRSKEFLYQVINAIPDPIFVKNEQYEWIVLNEAYCRFIGYSYNVIIGKSDYDLFSQHQADVFRKQDNLVFQTHQPQENEEEFTDVNGKTYFIATKRSLHYDSAGNRFLVGIIRDITERKRVEEELKRQADELYRSNNELKIQENNLRKLAYYDSLTGLSNRKFFHEQFCDSIEWARTNNLMLGLLFIDLDGFKKVNDTLGHDIGDRLLIIIAQRLNNALRATDIVSRLGGDEFTVILRSVTSKEIVANLAEKLLNIITEPIMLDGNLTRVSASIGISIYPEHGDSCETLIKQADTAMYQAKHLGKNRYEFTNCG